MGKRRDRKTLKRRVQYAERAYSENTNEDIQKIIQQLEEEATQGQSDSRNGRLGVLAARSRKYQRAHVHLEIGPCVLGYEEVASKSHGAGCYGDG